MTFATRSTEYNGGPDGDDEDVVAGDGVITVDFHVTHPGITVLTLWARTTGGGVPFKPMRTDSQSCMYEFDATGRDYYFTWMIIMTADGLEATLDAD